MNKAHPATSSKPVLTQLTLQPVQGKWLLLASSLAIAPHLLSLPPWLAISAIAALFWHATTLLQWQKPPSRLILFFTAIALTIGIFLQFRSIIGQGPGIAFLVCLTALKQLEAKNRRDGFLLVMLGFFVALTALIQAQTFLSAAVLLLTTYAYTVALHSLHQPAAPPQQLLRRSALMLTQALPFLLILFILFPRINGPLWGLPNDAHSGLSGLSDSMTPGSLINVALSDEIAFRVKFNNKPPPQHLLYWRGPVLSHYNGRTWQQAWHTPLSILPYPVNQSVNNNRLEQDIVLEPHNKPWLFALEHPTKLPTAAKMSYDYQLLAANAITERMRYQVVSDTTIAAGQAESLNVLVFNTLLPANSNPQTRALGESWRKKYDSAAAIVSEAEKFFREKKLVYTLDPAPLGNQDIDDFLFRTGEGFCEHFASAYVFALRAAGVPARVITGYQGGEINPFDGQLTVRQADAHAWAEVWLPQIGWVRKDPTAISAPARIDRNISAAVRNGNRLPFMAQGQWNWLHSLRQRWEAASDIWNRWVVGYNALRQSELLAKVGVPDWQRMTLWMAVLCSVAAAAMFFWALLQRQSIKAEEKLWRRVQQRLQKCGLPKHAWEGPQDYSQRVSTLRPDLKEALSSIAKLYARIRYAADSTELPRLQQQVANFKP